ncbi:MAG: Ethanolamine utilization protein EutN/carboxysome structural protein Ccml [Clostridia bacterium]|jgi:ethanolamine utilization protein EutN|nr:Ethanolamine utilization protein EutN/carboxysome structural protein Ccml [Clostridia bacterium]
MILGKVIGTVVSTRKCSNLVGYKLLTIRPLFGNKENIFVAADLLGAGIGECVLITTDNTTQYALNKSSPIDALVVGIVDSEPQIENV